MRRYRMNISLVVSEKMGSFAKKDAEEHSRIRLSSKARSYFQPQENVVEVAVEGRDPVVLSIHQALLSDLSNPNVDITKVGFVTQRTYDAVVSGAKVSHIWVSESVDELIVGSDPEFGLVDSDGHFVYAKDVTEHGLDEPVGHDGPCMELRPNPVASIDGHVDNIKSLVKKAASYRKITPYQWWTGATYKSPDQDRRFTLGGHIHVGSPAILGQKSPEDTEVIHRRVIRVLDELVGLILTRIDTPYADQRRKLKYGFFGDFRRQANRFEWRTPSAIWLTHPDLARAVIGTTKAVSEECYRRMADKKFNRSWVAAAVHTEKSFLCAMKCSDDNKVKELLQTSHTKLLNDGQCEEIYKKLRNMSTYRKYKEYIDNLIRFTSLSSDKVAKMDLFSMKESWLNNKPLL